MIILGIAGLLIAISLATDFDIPGWTAITAGLLAMLLVNSFFLVLAACVVILARRTGLTFLPLRDCGYFIDRMDAIYKRS